jgi:protein subunit release factor A
MGQEEIKKQIEDLENEMSQGNFWDDKDKAQTTIRTVRELKEKLLGVSKYDNGSSIMTILSGAGGDDS